MLINGLSLESNTATMLHKGWRFQEELLATLAELLDFHNRNYLLAHGVKRHELGQPIYINRPNKQKRKATKEELREMFKAGLGPNAKKEVK